MIVSIISDHFRLFPVVSSPFLETPMENGLGLPIDSGDFGTDSDQIWSTRFKHFEAFCRKKIIIQAILKNLNYTQISKLQMPKMSIFGQFYPLKGMIQNVENDQLDFQIEFCKQLY